MNHREIERQIDNIYKKYLDFSEAITDRKVPAEVLFQQEALLKKLEVLLEFESFYFIVEIGKNIPLRNKKGFDQYLGFTPFDMREYLHSLYPYFTKYHNIQAVNFIERMTEGKMKDLRADTPILKSFQSLINKKNNKIYKIKRLLYPFSFNQNFQVWEYLNLFTLCDEASEFDTYKIEAGTAESLNSKIIKEVVSELKFTFSENDYIKKYNEVLNLDLGSEEKYTAIKSISVKTINDEFTDKVNTINKYKREIERKITDVFGVPEFPDFEDAVYFLRNHNLLPK